MMGHALRIGLVIWGLVLAGAVRAADTPAPAPAGLSAQVVEAIGHLKASDYQARQDAVAEIQAALAQGISQMVLTDDPEARTRIADIMEYNQALSRWAIDALQQPLPERTAMVQWAMSPKMAPLIGKLYSTRSELRAEGIKELAKNSDANATAVLVRLIRDDDRAIRMVAMDVIRDRPATPAVIDALWNIATNKVGGAATNGPMRTIGPGRLVLVGGLPYGGRSVDENAAIDTLIHLKDPSVPGRVRAFLEERAKDKSQPEIPSPRAKDSLRAVLSIAAGYQVKEAVPLLMQIVAAPINGAATFNFNGQPAYLSGRTAALAAVCLISGQKPEDYNLTMTTQLNQWTVPNVTAENEAAQKLATWYQNHRAEWEPAATSTAPATAPATLPAQ